MYKRKYPSEESAATSYHHHLPFVLTFVALEI